MAFKVKIIIMLLWWFKYSENETTFQVFVSYYIHVNIAMTRQYGRLNVKATGVCIVAFQSNISLKVHFVEQSACNGRRIYFFRTLNRNPFSKIRLRLFYIGD